MATVFTCNPAASGSPLAHIWSHTFDGGRARLVPGA